LYPRPGEIFALSAFYKEFTSPIIEVVDAPGGERCRITFKNGTAATNYGAELEIRRTLDFLPGALSWLTLGANFTWVESSIDMPASIGVFAPGTDLQGQSRFLLNVNAIVQDPGGGFSASLLLNYFADRISRYGQVTGTRQAPNVIEAGRVSLDGKVQRRLGPHLSLSLSAKNLTNQRVLYFNPGPDGPVTAGSYRPGVSASFGLGYSH
jgi:outer membrane receptor protein involved in Fe transport